MTELNSINQIFQPSANAGGCPPVVSSEHMRWFVMRVSYCRELKAQEQLEKDGLETYVPMKTQRTDRGKQNVSAVHNLIFVRTTREFMDIYKREKTGYPIYYFIDKSTGLPMVVRDKEMNDFIQVVADQDNDVMYLDDPKAPTTKGTPVEVMFGPYTGVHGKLLRIRKDRKVVLQLAGLVAIAVSGIPMEYLKVLEK